MRRDLEVTIAALSVLVLAGCAGLQYNEAKTMKPAGSPFDQALYKEYIGQSKSEYDQANYRSSDLWAEKAMLAAKGQTPKPTQVSDWHLPSLDAPEMTTARERLQAALDKGGGNVAPAEMAAAQVGWDCWAEQQRVEENFQPEDIAYCRKRFYDNITKVEAALAPKTAAPAPAPKAASPKDYLVFFDWNKATLTPEAKKIIADAVASGKSIGAKAIECGRLHRPIRLAAIQPAPLGPPRRGRPGRDGEAGHCASQYHRERPRRSRSARTDGRRSARTAEPSCRHLVPEGQRQPRSGDQGVCADKLRALTRSKVLL